MELIGAVIPKHEKQAQGAQLRLTSGFWKDAVHPSCGSPKTSRGFALGAGNIDLVYVNARHTPSRHCGDARA